MWGAQAGYAHVVRELSSQSPHPRELSNFFILFDEIYHYSSGEKFQTSTYNTISILISMCVLCAQRENRSRKGINQQLTVVSRAPVGTLTFCSLDVVFK